ncbi:hypothetical protein OAO18_06870 [Francisellaceae bacterium]|nr:hypothetical protein [Francisellaceae bacterium]
MSQNHLYVYWFEFKAATWNDDTSLNWLSVVGSYYIIMTIYILHLASSLGWLLQLNYMFG